jgi:TonB family protein
MPSLLRGCRTGAASLHALAAFGSILLLVLAPISPSAAQAQAERSKRKVVRMVEPDYPSIIKHAHIGGSVRLNITVLANGDVATVETVGGNPILVESATKAVLKWKYAPAASQTRQEVQINFTPD